jgi:hypothetical protein
MAEESGPVRIGWIESNRMILIGEWRVAIENTITGSLFQKIVDDRPSEFLVPATLHKLRIRSWLAAENEPGMNPIQMNWNGVKKNTAPDCLELR